MFCRAYLFWGLFVVVHVQLQSMGCSSSGCLDRVFVANWLLHRASVIGAFHSLRITIQRDRFES